MYGVKVLVKQNMQAKGHHKTTGETRIYVAVEMDFEIVSTKVTDNQEDK